MKTIVAGSRTFNDYEYLKKCLDELPWEITEVVCGMAKGADLLGKRYAEEKGIPVTEMPANWRRFGGTAGFIRNARMAQYGEAAVIFWNGISRGSGNMIEEAQKEALQVQVHKVECP